MRMRDAIRMLVAACVVIAALSAAAPAQAACPDPRDPEADYLCPVGPAFLLPALSDFAGWDQTAHWGNIRYGDLRGTGQDDLVARGPDGVQVYRWSESAGQWIQLAVPPILPDSEGWGNPARVPAFDLGDVDGDGRDELVARGNDGIVVFRFQAARGDNAGVWTQLTTSGPLPMSVWREARYYETIELSPIGALPGTTTQQLVARGPEGYAVWRWNGSGWTPLRVLSELSDARGFDRRETYTAIEAWDRELLFARSATGMEVYRYDAGTDGWEVLSTNGPCPEERYSPEIGRVPPCDIATIQLAHGIKGAGDDPVLLARNRFVEGVHLSRFDRANRSWVHGDAQVSTPFHEPLYRRLPYAITLQTADLDGDGDSELLGRGESGVMVFEIALQKDGRLTWSKAMSVGRPQLTGDAWHKPDHFATIETPRLGTSSPARSLVARGQHGLRTWSWDARSKQFERPLPYGVFPPIDARVLDAVSGWLGIASGTVRDIYTDPRREPDAGRMEELQRRLASTCAELEESSPPWAKRCTAPGSVAGVTDAAWTQAANTLMAELYWAQNVIRYYAGLDATQQRMFLDQLGAFPSITGDLALKRPPATASLDVSKIIEMSLQTIVATNIPGVSQAAGVTALAFGWMAAFTPVVSGKQPGELRVKTNELQAEMAKVHQEMRDALVQQRRFVLGDPGLLGAVGRQVAGEVWRYDPNQIQSAARRSFTLELYQAILPSLWDHWTVINCRPIGGGLGWDGGPRASCHGPGPGPLVRAVAHQEPTDRTRSWVDWDGLVPKQDPCDHDFRIDENRHCRWQSLDSHGYGPTVQMLLGEVGADCRFDPRVGTTWHYGCPLGVPAEDLLNDRAGWRFLRRGCNYARYWDPAVSCHVAAEPDGGRRPQRASAEDDRDRPDDEERDEDGATDGRGKEDKDSDKDKEKDSGKDEKPKDDAPRERDDQPQRPR